MVSPSKIGIFSLKPTQGKGLKIMTAKQLLQRLPIAPPKVNGGNTSKSLLNEIRQMYFLYTEQNKLLKMYVTIYRFQ